MEKFFKRYVWHDERTPYLTRVANLTPIQVRYEIFAYALFMGMLSGVLAVVTLSPGLPHGGAAIVPLYAFSVCCAALVLGFTRHPWAALWSAGAPLGLLAYFVAWGFPPQLELADKVLLISVACGWLVYSRRVIAVARTWQRSGDTPGFSR